MGGTMTSGTRESAVAMPATTLHAPVSEGAVHTATDTCTCVVVTDFAALHAA